MTKSRISGTAAVFVAYSPVYGNTSLWKFVDLMRRYDRSCRIIAVNNNPALRLAELDGVTIINGSNVAGEFSAWQEGLNALRESEPRSGVSGPCVFANDTFCVNQQMGLFEEHAFRFALTHVHNVRQAAACGELSTFDCPFSMADLQMQDWICTYLFAANRAALDALDWRLQEPSTSLSTYVAGGTEEEAFFTDKVDPALRQHLVAWLFGRADKPRWYRSGRLDASNAAMFKLKADAIISEKLLSARMRATGVEIVSTHDQFKARLVRKLLRHL